MRKPFIAGNWKMNKTVSEAVELVAKLKEIVKDERGEIVVIPPFTALFEVKKIISGSRIELGAQNLYWKEKGAFTGEISPLMLKDIGCKYVIVGHSERRQHFNETDEIVNLKIKAALENSLIPIFCIGEKLEQRDKGETLNVIERQFEGGLSGIDESKARKIVIAYEPVWAIGTGRTATPEQAQEVHSFIRTKLRKKYGNEIANCAIILYGGSVKPENAHSLIKQKDIDGVLVGGASLEAESFGKIIEEGWRAFREK
ncbi:triose-phosphate isomerase [Candidatus Aminicenantes bacterium AC-335-B20]|jgi:triosephosphate isomerase|nr:triose-phosphate isomerase [SCandidatus Aminicenantes bacterium Aminicenantia_JdfR_composite]MCP2596453.1 triose-phosphate isomerase [Candidatus Aminicenantes bacterium AC-335-G13]MCP2598846.1 triose-phosphate isomerase [Candidatus Aminicenantes bacterium AC-335-B20]MCP2606590.1 triose-phosphate isomerase [Candidatus Aminicenantes bacterium AC-708-I09]MCP2618963.1 triose-phosphate isomerase [Candidatus Aminicenantes bacterium AC-335-A11]MCP2620917.1 triose-phosphate isomerase [Candidatus Am